MHKPEMPAPMIATRGIVISETGTQVKASNRRYYVLLRPCGERSVIVEKSRR
jgi:hypothetical protein